MNYLRNLNVKTTWLQQEDKNIKQDTIVILKEDRLPPLRWTLGRVIKTYLGQDDIVYVVRVRT